MSAPSSQSAPLLGWRIGFGALLCVLVVAPWLVPPAEEFPPVIWPLPEDPVEARKARLVNELLPLIRASNRRILMRRAHAEELLQQQLEGKAFDDEDQEWLAEMAERYRMPAGEMDEAWFRLLLRRIDIIPADLALAQAALESAWGDSRFALEGNNYFGHWCFEPGCGLVPSQRPEGATYEVAAFDSPRESVRRYMLNLNSHPSYKALRRERERLRTEQQPITGMSLATGLSRYSELGEDYAHILHDLIRSNGFDRFESF